MSSRRGALLAALGLALLAGLGVWGAWTIPGGPGFATVGAAAFPMVLAGSLAVLALAAIVQALRGRIPDEALHAEDPLLPGSNARIGWMIAAMFGSPLGLYLFGFLAGGAIAFAAVARAFGARSWAAILCWSIGATIVVWLLFDKVLTLKLGNELIRLPL